MDSVRELIEANFRVSNDKTSRKKESMKICPCVKVVKVGEGRKKTIKIFRKRNYPFFFFSFFFSRRIFAYRERKIASGEGEKGDRKIEENGQKCIQKSCTLHTFFSADRAVQTSLV